jgi:DNA polymerase III epsilon subunit-like protein
MDLSSRLRAIVRTGPPKPVRELTYEPDTGTYEGTIDLSRVGAILGGQAADTPFGQCLIVDRRYEADRFHGAIRIGECDVDDLASLAILDPLLARLSGSANPSLSPLSTDRGQPLHPGDRGQTPDGPLDSFRRTIFIDLETTGLSGGAGTVAFLVGCGYFDFGAFQVRQFLLTSYASERALLHAVADFFEGADLIVTYNGKTFDVPVMETRWLFHRLQVPLASVPHFDMLHPARRLWRGRAAAADSEDGGCRLSTLERTLLSVSRVGDVGGFEIPGRFFQFLRSGDPRPLEPVLEHNRLDLVSLAAVMSRGLALVREGHSACRDCAEALALGRIYERAATQDRVPADDPLIVRAEWCYRRASESRTPEIRGEALYRLALRHRRERRFAEAAAVWRDVIALTEPRGVRRIAGLHELRQFAVEALAIHQEHRERDLTSARELALFALEEADGRRADGMRHRLARLDRKLTRKTDAQLFPS